MIKVFAVCKNDRFIRVIEPMLLQRDVHLLGTCLRLDTILTAVGNSKPDIILLDANWPHQTHFFEEIINSIIKHLKPIKIILVTNFYEVGVANKVKQLNVSGYFFRASTDIENIYKCIEQVHAGHIYLVEQ